MTRVIHTGDTHIGYQQYHSPARRQDFLAAFERVVDDAVTDDVAAVVHAGDLFHDRRPDLQDLLGTISALRRLDDADVPFLAVVGNHESTRGGQWLDLFERLGLATRLGREPYVVDGVAFYGLDHVPRSKRDELEYAYEPHDATHAALVAHGLFTPFAHADWETTAVLDASPVDFDVVLLGDNHAPGTERVDGTPVTYCGSTERASAAEREGRGYNLVSFDADGVDIRRRGIDTREFVFVEVVLGAGEGAERVREQVRQHDLTDAVVVVEIRGEGDPVTPASVETFAADRGALVARVTDRREFDPADDDVETIDFADPDEAVRERVDGMGLSPAALDVDDAVRSDLADANVRDVVRERVEERLDDGELAGFVGVDSRTEDGVGAADTVDSGAVPDEETTDAEAVADVDETANDGTDGPASDRDDGGDDTADDNTDADGGDDGVDTAERESGADSQVSMEDFL